MDTLPDACAPAFGVEPSPLRPRGSDPGLGEKATPARTGPMVTSTIGIRGLDKEDLRQASFNADQMRQLDQFGASREAAQSQAGQSGLTPARVDYLGGKP